MILILIFIYGLLFRLKNNQVIKTIESFENNITGVDKWYQTSSRDLMTGFWSSGDSDVIGTTVTNLISIKMKDNQKGTLNYKGVNYPLTVDSNALLTTNKVKGKRYKINPNPDLESYRLSFNLPLNVNTAEIISVGDTDYSEKSLIFKYVKGKLDPKAIEVIRSGSFRFKPSAPNNDGNFYSIPSISKIKKYNFKYNAIEPVYKSLNEGPGIFRMSKKNFNKYIKLMKEKYNNKMTFQLVRQFNFANGQTQLTPFSQLYNFDYIKDESFLFKIKHLRLKEELNENKLENKFHDITTYPYFHECTKSDASFGFARPDLLFIKDDVELKNGSQKYFENNLHAPNAKSVTRTITSDFTPKPLGAINTFNKDNFNEGIMTETTIGYL
tara:strand:+ start:49 stop:1197 length:1149 start_codon:yes stop_codon:yes gene_type:complete